MIKNLKKPSMIIFDYGHTLVYEKMLDYLAGYKKLCEIAVENPENISGEQMLSLTNILFFDSWKKAHNEDDLDCRWDFVMAGFFSAYGMKFSQTPLELETIFWDAIAPGQAMPFLPETLELLKEKNIRTAVISNISFSEQTLKNRINAYIPNNSFEFFLASSEFQVRKPNPVLFKTALRKADLPANEVWYCGDNVHADVHGANNCGMVPVWINNTELECAYFRSDFEEPNCEHIKVNNWREFCKLINDNF